MQNPITLAPAPFRHPFRRAFVQVRIEQARHHDDHDLKLFALSFTAFFVCFYTFIF